MVIRKFLLILMVLMVPVLVKANSVSATVPVLISFFSGGNYPGFYIAPGGSDSNVGDINHPFASFGKAQAAMQAGSTKITYVRGGSYTPTPVVPATAQVSTAAFITNADNGETFSYYPPDGVNSAVINGQTSAGCTANYTSQMTYGFWIEGGSNITINGLTFKNMVGSGIMVHGGNSDYGVYFPFSTYPAADSVTLINNLVYNIFDTQNVPGGCSDLIPPGYVVGPIMADGQVTNLHVTHNVVHDSVGGFGIRNDCYTSGDNLSGLVIDHNFLYNIASDSGVDSGAIYIYEHVCIPTSANAIISNNYIRDYGLTDQGTKHGIYLDDFTSYVTVSGNIETGTGQQCMQIHGGSHNVYSGNICDMNGGAFGAQGTMAYAELLPDDTGQGMTGNVYENSIEIQSSSITQGGVASSITSSTPLTVQDNLKYSYGSGAISGTFASSSDPSLSCWAYILAGGSAAYGSPVDFPTQVVGYGTPGYWGPPGFVIPQTGTAPSNPHSC